MDSGLPLTQKGYKMATLEKAPTSNFWSTSLNGAINDSVTTITLNSTVGLQAPGRLVINRQDSTGKNTPSAREVISFTGISGSDLTGVTRGADNSTARSHADGSLVESAIVVGNWDTLYDVINEEHDLDGTHDTTKVVDLTTAQTLTNKTLTSPKLNEDVALTSTSTELNALDGQTGAWTSFTPSIAGLTLGNGSLSGAYVKIGKTVNFRVILSFGTTSAISALTLTFPVTISGFYTSLSHIANVTFYDTSSGVLNSGMVRSDGKIYVLSASNPYSQVASLSSDVPFTWANGDYMAITGTYQAS